MPMSKTMIIAVLAVIGILGGLWWYVQKMDVSRSPSGITPNEEVAVIPSPDTTSTTTASTSPKEGETGVETLPPREEPAPPTPTPPSGITVSAVATHASESSCWTIINNSVYDLTAWIARHPGGKQAILALCGKDGTEAFTDKHSGDRRPESTLAGYKIGEVSR